MTIISEFTTNSKLLLLLLWLGIATANYIQLPSTNTSYKSRVPRGVKEVCYGDIGCFTAGPPWNSFGRIAYLPESPKDIDTRFLLYTRRNTNDPSKIIAGDINSLLNSHFDGSKPTKFIVHGFIDWGTSPWLKDMALQFLIQDDANAFCVDWRGGSQVLYGQAAANARVVGAEIAKLVKFLANFTGLKHEDVHIVGHSLGAHIGGYTGIILKDLGRITGMDPAGPYFEDTDPLIRLDETDAKFVEVLHTDAGTVIQSALSLQLGGFGIWQPSGHVDVYMSGGIKQPGCKDTGPIEAVLSDGLIEGGRYFLICPHCRSFEYMTESIGASCPWRSYSCPNWDEFQTGRCLRCPRDGLNKTCNGAGNRAVKPGDNSFNNKYWIATGPKSPFCRYHYHVQMELSSKSTKSQKGNIWFKLIGTKASNDFYLANGDDTILLKSGAHYDFLVLSPKDLGETIKSIEVKWEHDASWFDVSQWQFGTPTIYPQKLTVFSGEYQTEFSFCDESRDPIKSKKSRTISNRC